MKIKKNSFYSALGQIFYSISQWLILIAIARFSSVANLGSFTLGLAISAPIVMFFSFRLRLILASDTQGEYQFVEYLVIRVITMLLAFIGIFIIASFFCHTPLFYLTVLFVGLTKCLDAVSEIFLSLTQLRYKTHYISVSLFLRGIASVFSLTSILYLTKNIFYASIGLVIVRLFILVFYDAYIPRWLGIERNIFYKLLDYFKVFLNNISIRKRQLSFLIVGIPFSIIAAIDSLNTNTPGYFIAFFYGHNMLGYYAPLNYCFTGSSVLMGMLILPTIPFLISFYHENNWELFYFWFYRIIASIVVIGALAVAMASIFGAEFLKFMFGFCLSRSFFLRA